jgi:hypothetical protein
MNQFQELLDPTSELTPGEQQTLASDRLPDVVRTSHLRWWVRPRVTPPTGQLLLVIIAPYSHYDLAMLDILDETVAKSDGSKTWNLEGVYVSNLQSYHSIDDLTLDIPDIKHFPLQTPLVASWDNGKLEWACGKSGRDLAAKTVGIPADAFSRDVIARIPTPNFVSAK